MKEYPEEIESEDSNESEDFEIIENDRVLAHEIGIYKKKTGDDLFDDLRKFYT